jgi:hypothetical protein
LTRSGSAVVRIISTSAVANHALFLAAHTC